MIVPIFLPVRAGLLYRYYCNGSLDGASCVKLDLGDVDSSIPPFSQLPLSFLYSTGTGTEYWYDVQYIICTVVFEPFELSIDISDTNGEHLAVDVQARVFVLRFSLFSTYESCRKVSKRELKK